MVGEVMSDIPWVHFVKSYGSAIYILPVAAVGFILGQRTSYAELRMARMNQTSREVEEKTYSSYKFNPFDLGTKGLNFRDRIWREDTVPLFKPNELYDPTPYAAPTVRAPKRGKPKAIYFGVDDESASVWSSPSSGKEAKENGLLVEPEEV